jgi:hypothetical protein
MKTRLNSVLILAAALSASALVSVSAASNNNLPVAFSVNTLTASAQGGEQISRGTSRGDVAYAMRLKARQELSPDVWVYSGYHADLDLANQQNCGTLVITFADNKVADIQLVNGPAAVIIASNLKVGTPSRVLASTK